MRRSFHERVPRAGASPAIATALPCLRRAVFYFFSSRRELSLTENVARSVLLRDFLFAKPYIYSSLRTQR